MFCFSFPCILQHSAPFLLVLNIGFPLANVSNLSWNSQTMVTEIKEMVLPEIRNFSTIAIGVSCAYLLVRSFRG